VLGRRRKWTERMDARFPDGTIARIDAVLRPKEARTDLIFEAVEKEIDRRESGGTATPQPAEASMKPKKAQTE
jgi:hypothetical protein